MLYESEDGVVKESLGLGKSAACEKEMKSDGGGVRARGRSAGGVKKAVAIVYKGDDGGVKEALGLDCAACEREMK